MQGMPICVNSYVTKFLPITVDNKAHKGLPFNHVIECGTKFFWSDLLSSRGPTYPVSHCILCLRFWELSPDRTKQLGIKKGRYLPARVPIDNISRKNTIRFAYVKIFPLQEQFREPLIFDNNVFSA